MTFVTNAESGNACYQVLRVHDLPSGIVAGQLHGIMSA